MVVVVVVVLGGGGGGQGGDAQRVRADGEGGRRLDEGGRVAERAQAPLLGQDLLVGHGVDGVGEREGGTGWRKGKGRKYFTFHVRTTLLHSCHRTETGFGFYECV